MPDAPGNETVGQIIARELGHAQQFLATLEAMRPTAPDAAGWGSEVPTAMRLAIEIRLAQEREYILTVFAALIADARALKPLPPEGSLH